MARGHDFGEFVRLFEMPGVLGNDVVGLGGLGALVNAVVVVVLGDSEAAAGFSLDGRHSEPPSHGGYEPLIQVLEMFILENTVIFARSTSVT